MQTNKVIRISSNNPTTDLEKAIARQHQRANALIADALPELVAASIEALKHELGSQIMDRRVKAAVAVLTRILPAASKHNDK